MNGSNGLIIGLTGSFNSGCGTAANYLETKGFKQLSLTTKIKEEAEKRGLISPDRENLQDIGDDLRKNHGCDYLAKEVAKKIDASSDKKFVVKSFRSNFEVKYFRDKYPSFILLNIDAERNIRYGRKEYTSEEIFDRADERDSGKGQPEYGQHVRLCVDRSDIVINNNEDEKKLYNRINRYIELIESPGKYPPLDCEINMANACRQSMKTGCLKRAVGAVITKGSSQIASGYNSTPENISTCLTLSSCYRNDSRKCPKCNIEIQLILEKCINCKTEIGKDKISELNKNLDLCRAIHAEERAILQGAKIGGGISLKGTTLYTTTFPCILCAKKIVEVGIEKVFYIEPYPFREAKKLLIEAGITLQKFEGAKSRIFDDLYTKQYS